MNYRCISSFIDTYGRQHVAGRLIGQTAYFSLNYRERENYVEEYENESILFVPSTPSIDDSPSPYTLMDDSPSTDSNTSFGGGSFGGSGAGSDWSSDSSSSYSDSSSSDSGGGDCGGGDGGGGGD